MSDLIRRHAAQILAVSRSQMTRSVSVPNETKLIALKKVIPPNQSTPDKAKN